MEAAEYRVWVRAPAHVRSVDGVDCGQVDTELLEKTPQSTARELLESAGRRDGCCRICAPTAAWALPPGTRPTARKSRTARRYWT